MPLAWRLNIPNCRFLRVNLACDKLQYEHDVPLLIISFRVFPSPLIPIQIEYSNSHASNSFDVYRGDKTILTCVTSILPTATSPTSPVSSSSSTHGPSAPSSSRLSDEQHFPKGANQNRHSTCFTARLVKLQKGKEGGENSKSGGGNGVHCSGTMHSTGSFDKRF